MPRKKFGIKRISPVDPNDVRGLLRQWKFPDGRQITVCVRRAGTKTGGHFHSGKDPSKSPERLFIARGRAILRVNRKTQQIERTVGEGDEITIYPGAVHQLIITKDAIILEYRVTHFDKKHPDTTPVAM